MLKGIYNPLSRPLFIYVNRKSVDRREVGEFVEPLPAQAYQAVMQRFARREVGTGFGGEREVGLTIDELLSRQPRLAPTRDGR